MKKNRPHQVLALTGGVGGAKLALGLAQVVAPESLTIAVNTGDDFRHLGLAISPDIDTLLYTLSGLAHPENGWGRKDETWSFMHAMQQLGGDTWFQLGDRDLALHIERTRRLAAGESLSHITAAMRAALHIPATILPMTHDDVHTQVRTDKGWLAFQDYFVRQHCEPVVKAIRYCGADRAQPHPTLLQQLTDPALRAVMICPSNPWLSIGPLLAMPALRHAIATTTAPVIAVSPLIGSEAVKGPTAKLMRELKLTPSTTQIAHYYRDLIDGLVIDPKDADIPLPANLAHCVEPILMTTLADRQRVAHTALAFADALRGDRARKA